MGWKDHDGGVTRVPKISRGGVRDPGRFIVTGKIVAELDLARHHADDGEYALPQPAGSRRPLGVR